MKTRMIPKLDCCFIGNNNTSYFHMDHRIAQQRDTAEEIIIIKEKK
jgi:hypothetical protein